MAELVYVLKVAGVLFAVIVPLLGLFELVDRWHDRVWRRFAHEKGAILTQTARGPFKYWEAQGPRKLEICVADAWVTLRYMTGTRTTKASTSVAGFPPFLVRSKAARLRRWGPAGRNAVQLEVGDPRFDSQFEIRIKGDASLRALFDETIRERHMQAPGVIVKTDRDGLLAAEIDSWGRDTRELSSMLALLEAYVERAPSRRGA